MVRDGPCSRYNCTGTGLVNSNSTLCERRTPMHRFIDVRCRVLLIVAVLIDVHSACAAAQLAACEIQVVDKETGWPVPMVMLETVHSVKFVTDNAGRVAFDLPEFI